ncbi:activity-regulated cytoskeleton associated protein 2-like [Salvia splendens]|uniref:activity-regulated cytoskeleton associated protein 2-like n=1 Tax=Salvia splendens TaxID=180675 RepID=UPI001C25AF95|nr:activity-regulated cytoskeleton associated protein 2-like [Salvia splendens]
MPRFYGHKIECTYEFLHEFCKPCSIQKRPPNSTEKDYRLRALPFALKGVANTWLLRLPENSISSWADFRLLFLDYFFPSNKTYAIKKEILEFRQDYDEALSQYWSRFKGLLDSCPNNRMCEAEVYNIFYEGANPESKDLLNSYQETNKLEKAIPIALGKNNSPEPGEKVKQLPGPEEVYQCYCQQNEGDGQA